MSTKVYYDPESGLLKTWNPADLNAQQKANYVFLQGLLEVEYERGFRRGLEVGHMEAETDKKP